jgi:hypothetical protein
MIDLSLNRPPLTRHFHSISLTYLLVLFRTFLLYYSSCFLTHIGHCHAQSLAFSPKLNLCYLICQSLSRTQIFALPLSVVLSHSVTFTAKHRTKVKRILVKSIQPKVSAVAMRHTCISPLPRSERINDV